MSGEDLVIDAGVNMDTIHERIGVGENERLRASSRRENYLQKFARIMSGVPLTLTLHPSKANTEFDSGELTINIPTYEPSQPLTDIPEKVYEMMVQEVITLHEIGHVMYSDFDAFASRRRDLSQEWVPLFDQLFNAVEDGVIEAQLRGEFAISGELLIYYANHASDATFGTVLNPMEDDPPTIYTFHQACITALMDMCVYDTGTLPKIYDESNSHHKFAYQDDGDLFRDFLPDLKQFATDVLSEPNGRERVNITYDFFIQKYRDKVDESEIGGQTQAKNKDESPGGLPGDFIGSSGDSAQSADVEPTDADNLPDADDVAAALDGSEEEDDESDASEAASSEDGPQERESDMGGEGENEDGPDGFSEDLPGSIAGSLPEDDEGNEHLPDSKADELTEEYSGEVQREAENEAGSMLDEAEEYKELFAGESNARGATDADLGDLEIEIPQEENPDRDRWKESKRHAKQLADTFQRKLKDSSRSNYKRNQRRGRMNRRDLTKAARGDPRSFEQKQNPDDPEYACIIVDDRSSSMSGRPIFAQEKGIGALAKSLQSIGVDVSILDLYGNRPRLALPFGMDIEDRLGVVFSGSTSGGTPLAQMITLARERLNQMHVDDKFMIVLSDDKPANPDRYLSELDKCSFPILGVSMRIEQGHGNVADPAPYFHRHKKVADENELYRRLRQLAEEIVMDQ